jgi:hypothetical protein
MGIEIAAILKAVAAIIALVGSFFGIKHYASLAAYKRHREAIDELTEVNNESYEELADDVLDGGHPYSVSESSVAEIVSPRPEPEVGVATDSRREGGAGGSGGNGNGAAKRESGVS